MTLYFYDSNENWQLVKRDILDKGDVLQPVIQLMLDDLNVRRPNFISYYQRIWTDERGWTWIDYGSHTEFYVLKNE